MKILGGSLETAGTATGATTRSPRRHRRRRPFDDEGHRSTREQFEALHRVIIETDLLMNDADDVVDELHSPTRTTTRIAWCPAPTRTRALENSSTAMEGAAAMSIAVPSLVPGPHRHADAGAADRRGDHAGRQRRIPRLQRVVTVLAITTSLSASLLMLFGVSQHVDASDRHRRLGRWRRRATQQTTRTAGDHLVVDRLSAMMLVVSSTVLLAVILAIGPGSARRHRGRQPVSIFQPTYLILCAGVSNAFLAGDLFNLYVSFEVLLTASYVLLTVGASIDRLRAGAMYVMVSMVSSLIFLLGIAFAYATTGTLNLAEMSIRLNNGEVPDGIAQRAVRRSARRIRHQSRRLPLCPRGCRLVPDGPGTGHRRVRGLADQGRRVRDHPGAHAAVPFGGSMDSVLMIAGLLTMLIGIAGAIAQSDIKRLLSFTLVSHIGYMVFGIALSSKIGMAAAIYYVAHHILVQTTLFLVVGLIEAAGRLSVAAKTRRLIASPSCRPVPGAGPQPRRHPPFSGFIGKVGLLQAGAVDGSVLAWTLVVGGLVTSLLTLYVVARIWTKAFWRARPTPPRATCPTSGRRR